MHAHKENIEDKIKKAKALSAVKVMRWSNTREEVYKALLNNKKPVTAYQLLEQLSKHLGKNVKPASVYRSLEGLCALGLAIRIESLNAFIVCQHPEENHEHVLMVCKQCGSADEICDSQATQRLRKDASNQGFSVERQVLELHGSCKDCTKDP